MNSVVAGALNSSGPSGPWLTYVVFARKNIGRYVPGKEEATLSDYRKHMALYRTDEGLTNAHMAGPWITVWDDHDVADNSWKV